MTKGETVRGQSPGILLILIYYHENVNDSQEVNHNENLIWLIQIRLKENGM